VRRNSQRSSTASWMAALVRRSRRLGLVWTTRSKACVQSLAWDGAGLLVRGAVVGAKQDAGLRCPVQQPVNRFQCRRRVGHGVGSASQEVAATEMYADHRGTKVLHRKVLDTLLWFGPWF
jgi:hypothetical protein